MEFIIFISIALVVIGSLHAFVMNSVENYEGYGTQSQNHEWREFQRTRTGMYL